MCMKKLTILSAVFASFIGLSTFGQGYFQFATAKSQVYDGFSTGIAHVGATVRVAFLWGPPGSIPAVEGILNGVPSTMTTVTSTYIRSAAWSAIFQDPNFQLAVNSGSGNSLVTALCTSSGTISYNGGSAFAGPMSTTPSSLYTLFMIGWDAAYPTPAQAAAAGAAVGWSQSFDYTATAVTSTPNSMVGRIPAFGVAGLPTDWLLLSGQPSSQVAYVGATVNFSVLAAGAAPIYYQWQNNSGLIPGATNATFSITNTQLLDAGTYSVVVSNAYTSITSSNAVLQMLPVGAPSIQVNNQPAVGIVTALNSAQVAIYGGFTNGFVFYTLDGSTPTIGSTLYDGPFTLTNTVVVQAMSLSADFSQTAQAPAVTVQVIPVYNLQTSVIGSGTIIANPAGGPYASNSVVTLTANAAAHWAFDHWAGDATGSQNPLSLTMNGPRSVQAVFIKTAYPLTVSTPGGGSVTVNGLVISPATYYPIGSTVTLAAVASSGWSFLGWQGDASGTNSPLSVTMNQTNNIQAIFGTVVPTNAVGGGSIVLSLPNPIPFGTTLTASAVPDTGKYLVTWSGAASGTTTPTTISVTSANPTVSALFTALPGGKYSLSAVVMGNGSVAISPQQSYYSPGDTVGLNASTTYPGTSFYGWTGDISGTNSSIAVVMDTNKVVQANFGALPTVNISPLNLTVLAGSNAVLNANAAGLPPLSYQWENSQGNITGETNAALVIPDTQATNSGSYWVVVSNPFGSVTSAVATVTVVFPPSILLQPTNQNVAAGTSLMLSVLADGTAPLVYQWQDGAGAITGQTNADLILNPALTNYTENYSAVVSNPYGVVTSQVAAVFVYLPVSILTQPNSLVVPYSSPASFGVIAAGFPAPTSYQWTFNGTNLTSATNNTLTVSHIHLSNTGFYQVQVSNGYSSTNSSIATLNMSPSITSPFGGATTIWGRSATLSVGAIGSGELSYQWYLNGIAIDGETGPTLSFTSIQFTNGGLYSVVVNSPFGSITNAAAQVIVNPAAISLGFYPGLTISGTVGYSYIIQSSADLTDSNAWGTLTNLTLTEPVQLWVDTNVDASSPFNSKYFYRVLPGQ